MSMVAIFFYVGGTFMPGKRGVMGRLCWPMALGYYVASLIPEKTWDDWNK